MAATAAEKILADEEGHPLLASFDLMAPSIFSVLRTLRNASERRNS